MIHDDDYIEKYITSLISKHEGRLLSNNDILTNCIVTSKRLILEINDLENDLIQNHSKNLNTLLIVGAKLELLTDSIKKISIMTK